ncbi:hypothetical protein [Pontibacter sp. SGAir0037]|uniref:hypothetical protein n=1 Tax=Pontibacter sp. SGAir0037 TaxID=2571030 RepID=UPI0010CD3A32|nr:hypothetical protein [Pontibacter sp. SGAir0037]QCR23893.1 hypothetical protein C1N53_17085 [Pontibacter sp. SGAir0037]
MRKEAELIKLSDDQITILRNILGERVYFFYANKLQVEGSNGRYAFWADEFAVAFSAVNHSSEKFRTYINISADYKLSNNSTSTYYEFKINESSAPLWQEGSLQFGRLSSIKIFSDPILMVEIYQGYCEESEKSILHDCAMVFYSQRGKFLLQARQALIGGVDVVLDEAYIDVLVKDWKLRYTLV